MTKRSTTIPTIRQPQGAESPADRIRHIPIVVSNADKEMMHRIERFILAYHGDDLLHDIELTFPTASYRATFLAYLRACDPARWFEAEGRA
jgi:hypothetical protein